MDGTGGDDWREVVWEGAVEGATGDGVSVALEEATGAGGTAELED